MGLQENSNNKPSSTKLTTNSKGSSNLVGVASANVKRELTQLLYEINTDKAFKQPKHGFGTQVKVIAIFIIICIPLLIVHGVYLLTEGNPRQLRGIGSLVEAVLIVFGLLSSYLYIRHERRLASMELRDRIHAIAHEIETWPGTYVSLTTPMIPTITAYHTLRDGRWVVVPTLLLVKNDIVALGYGDKVPCKMSFLASSEQETEALSDTEALYASGSGNGYSSHILKRGQVFSPAIHATWKNSKHHSSHLEHFKIPSEIPGLKFNDTTSGSSSPAPYDLPNGRTCFRVLETPLRNHLNKVLLEESRQHQTVLQNQILVASKLCFYRVFPTILGCSVIINLIRFLVIDISQHSKPRMAIELLIGSVIDTTFPFVASMSLVWFWYLGRHFANASTLALFETLQRSKTDYTDDAGIDEFDVDAPAPTKAVVVSHGTIWSKMWWLMRSSDFRNLSRSTCLVESLGNITVIGSIDKEGTIASPFCAPEQLIFPTANQDIAILDLGEQQENTGAHVIEDIGWEEYIDSLKPLGLNFLLNSGCNTFRGKCHPNVHRRFNILDWSSNVSPAQAVCLCKVGKTIGFTTNSLDSYQRLVNINVHSPHHPASDQTCRSETHVANLLTTLVTAKDFPGEGQMFSSGHLGLLADLCTDFWDGREIKPFEDVVLKRLYYYYEHAKAHDLDIVAFAYRPVNVEKGFGIMKLIESSATYSQPTTNANRTKYFSNNSVICLEYAGFNYDDMESSLSSESSSLHEAKVHGVNYTASSTGVHKNASMASDGNLSNRLIPVEEDANIATNVKDDKSTDDIADKANVTDFDDDSATSDQESQSSQSSEETNLPKYLQDSVRKRKYRRKELTEMFSPGASESENDTNQIQALATELVDGQIFLGAITLCYEPKTDVCDFIEDLSLAGIRFVYFSKSSGRQSKAFAERLGLETDWNTCILLSSVSDDEDPSQGGYFEDYDIKARLPRGIENIRQHLKEVDDIPLQVSLFAECAPSAVCEMINIFQENGEIVCCIGSALSDSNTLTFAEADIAVGVEPIPHFNRILQPKPANATRANSASGTNSGYAHLEGGVNDGSITTSGALVTQLALGAALTTIPCSLFLQHDTSLYALTQVTREARHLIGRINQASLFLLGCYLSILCPALAFSMFFVPHEANIMATMTIKNSKHLRDLPRFAVYYITRFTPLVATTILVYMM
ncbi:hypothetical protein H4219_001822 [Mycoemilia scoparia]|uniref:Uncharacterized protein n=1 Tax=Mycoemilia scoparia TaxID=417184 RepID=A0A9W7ZZ33_9FUNG|nr:hypothetical protein H4219_001822 [Mycoemilia scoparia]